MAYTHSDDSEMNWSEGMGEGQMLLNISKFEIRVTVMMKYGAKSRDQAISRLMEADDWNGDIEYFCYQNGLPYGYFSKKVDQAPKTENNLFCL